VAKSQTNSKTPGAQKVKKERFKQLKAIGATYKATAKVDRALPWLMLGAFVAVLVPFVLGSLYLINDVITQVMTILIGVMGGLLAATFIFGRRAESAAFAQIRGKPGAAGAVLNSMRKGWYVTPGVAVTKNQDILHRVVGRPGVVLVAEGTAGSVENLLIVEKKKTQRYVGETPITEIICGDGVGEIPLRKLTRKVMRLPKVLSKAEAYEVNRKLGALGNQPIAIPKGPMPKGMRVPRGIR
jgi:hypothetical protein